MIGEAHQVRVDRPDLGWRILEVTLGLSPDRRVRPAPNCPGFTPRSAWICARHWSNRGCRPQTIRVGTLCVAINEQAITVLPAPGGATRRPCSWAANESCAACCDGIAFDGDSGAEPRADQRGRRWVGTCGCGPPELLGTRSDAKWTHRSREVLRTPRGDPVEAG